MCKTGGQCLTWLHSIAKCAPPIRRALADAEGLASILPQLLHECGGGGAQTWQDLIQQALDILARPRVEPPPGVPQLLSSCCFQAAQGWCTQLQMDCSCLRLVHTAASEQALPEANAECAQSRKCTGHTQGSCTEPQMHRSYPRLVHRAASGQTKPEASA